MREKFCLGDLMRNSLDEILADYERKDEVYREVISKCPGCSNPCEINREVNIFGQRLNISEEELDYASELEMRQWIGDALVDYCGWHAIEKQSEGKSLVWSDSLQSDVFLLNKGNKVLISYVKLSLDTIVKILLDGKEVYFDEGNTIEKEVCLDINNNSQKYVRISFIVSKLQRPTDVLGTQDVRMLGVGLREIVWV